MGGASSQLFWKSQNPEAALRAALAEFNAQIQELPSQTWDPNTATIGGIRDYKLSFLDPNEAAWSSLLLHLDSQLADPLAASLSRTMGTPSIAFYEFEQVAWGFSVYEQGESIARFWNRPGQVEEEPSKCAVDPNLIAAKFYVRVEDIAPYLNHVDPDDEDLDKAFPTDKLTLGDHWVRCDFMRRLGLRYPSPGDPGTRRILIRGPGVN